jgi:hypothetical protein
VVGCAAEPGWVQRDPAWDPNPRCTVAGASSVDNVFRPIGQGGGTATVGFDRITITGGNFTGSSGSGAAIAEGSMTNDSWHYGIEVRDNDAAGIVSAKGTFERVEFTNNTTDPGALGFIGAAMKARDEVEVMNSYVHDTQGNGLWCDQGCVDSASHPNGFWVHENLVVNNGRAGIRLENGSNPKALIENNQVHGNSPDATRGGISVRDSQNAIIQGNHFGGATIAGVAYPPNSGNVAIIASDSGGADRTNLSNIDIVNNDLSGEKATETIKGCELPDTIVYCSNPEQPISRTDTTPPTVIATGVDRTTDNVTATFSEDMLASSISGTTFKLFVKGSTTKLAATVSYSASTDTATLDPTNSLRSGVTYKAVVTTGAKDLAGNPLEQNHRWFFTR